MTILFEKIFLSVGKKSPWRASLNSHPACGRLPLGKETVTGMGMGGSSPQIPVQSLEEESLKECSDFRVISWVEI